jgi:hypothetical protein
VWQVPLGCLRGHTGSNGPAVLAKDLTELSDLLASTNHVLQRNSHLRASLTISVKKPSLSRSGSSAAKTTSTPKNLRKTPAKSKPAKSQKNAVKVEKTLGPRFSTQCKEKVKPSHTLPLICRLTRRPNDPLSAATNQPLQMLAAPSPGPRRRNEARLQCVAIEEESGRVDGQPVRADGPPAISPFVRSYRGGKGSTGGSGGYRMSMTIQPQTVANLASKFDTIVKEPRSSVTRHTGQHGLKLRTYDITKIISELNKLNNTEDQSSVKSKAKSSKSSDHLAARECDGSSTGSGGPTGDNLPRRNLCGGRDSRPAPGPPPPPPPPSAGETTARPESSGPAPPQARLPGHTSEAEVSRPDNEGTVAAPRQKKEGRRVSFSTAAQVQPLNQQLLAVNAHP